MKVRLALVATVVAAVFGAVMPAMSSAAGAAPVKPPARSHVTRLGGQHLSKSHRKSSRLRAHTAAVWSVTLTPSYTDLWPTQSVTLTATANQDVGPTPYYIEIYSRTFGGGPAASCGDGTTCTLSLHGSNYLTLDGSPYYAVISQSSTSQVNVQATSTNATVDYHHIDVSVSANPTTVPLGGTATVTATTSTDVGPSPYFTEIFDATTGTRVAVCGSGTTCTANVSHNAATWFTTDRYVAYVSDYSPSYPPSGIVTTSPQTSYVTWSNSGWRLALTAPSVTPGPETVTATANGDVGPTLYYISIFDETTGSFVGNCGTGTSCSVSWTPPGGPQSQQLIAFIGDARQTLPPGIPVASSNVVSTFYSPIIP